MGSIPNVGKVFSNAADYLDYLEGIKFGVWRPKFPTMHHCGAPDLKTWNGWQTRVNPVTDNQWLTNLASYYGNTMGWSAGPHFFVTPKHICVLSPPEKRGVHAVSFNATSWATEIVGDFDVEKFEGPIHDLAIQALAAQCIAAGWEPGPFKKGVSGLHFHRDDPKTSKTCPGKKIDKATVIAEIKAAMAKLSGTGETPDEKITIGVAQTSGDPGTVSTERGETLNVRAAATAKAPVVRVLKDGDKVNVLRRAKNGSTEWFMIGADEWVAGRYVEF